MEPYVEMVLKVVAWLAPIGVVLLLRGRIGATRAAWLLFAYGALELLLEHAGWTIAYVFSLTPDTSVIWNDHARDHAFMVAFYAVLAMVLLLGTLGVLLRVRPRAAWWTMCAALLVGGSVELVVDGPVGLLFHHTFPPNKVTGANILFVYLVAWVAALALLWRGAFREAPPAATAGR